MPGNLKTLGDAERRKAERGMARSGSRMDVARPVLFYDNDCGPCTVFARGLRALGRGRLDIEGLASPEADLTFESMSTEARFASMHLISGGARVSGSEAVVPLMEIVFGGPVGAGLKALPPVSRILVRLHRLLVGMKRANECGIDDVTPGRKGPG